MIILTCIADSQRKQTLKENFWIVEDEPLNQSICSKKDVILPESVKFSEKKQKSSKEYICHVRPLFFFNSLLLSNLFTAILSFTKNV